MRLYPKCRKIQFLWAEWWTPKELSPNSGKLRLFYSLRQFADMIKWNILRRGDYHGLSMQAFIPSCKRDIEDLTTRGERILITEARRDPAGFENRGRLQESRNANHAVFEPGKDKETDLLMFQEQAWLYQPLHFNPVKLILDFWSPKW